MKYSFKGRVETIGPMIYAQIIHVKNKAGHILKNLDAINFIGLFVVNIELVTTKPLKKKNILTAIEPLVS